MFLTPVADLKAKLMTRLGYDRFAAQGADIGAFVTTMLAHRHADRVVGIHLQHLAPVRPPYIAKADFDADELLAFARRSRFMADGQGYGHRQRTRPQTIAVAMHDSPAGLAAWLVEKRHGWADSAGDVERIFTLDDLITTVCLYWFTETYLSGANYYRAAARADGAAGLVHDRLPMVDMPVAGLHFLGDITYQPRRWADRHFNIQRWTVARECGHFGAAEQRELLVDDLRAFFRPPRAQGW